MDDIPPKNIWAYVRNDELFCTDEPAIFALPYVRRDIAAPMAEALIQIRNQTKSSKVCALAQQALDGYEESDDA